MTTRLSVTGDLLIWTGLVIDRRYSETLRRSPATRTGFPLPLPKRRNEHYRAAGRANDALRGASQQSAVQHAFAVDVHHEQVHFFIFQGPENDAIRHSCFDFGHNVAPVFRFGWHQFLELGLDTLRQRVAILPRKIGGNIMNHMKQCDTRFVLLRHGEGIGKGVCGAVGKIRGHQDSLEAWLFGSSCIVVSGNGQERNRAVTQQPFSRRSHEPALDAAAAMCPQDDEIWFKYVDGSFDFIVDISNAHVTFDGDARGLYFRHDVIDLFSSSVFHWFHDLAAVYRILICRWNARHNNMQKMNLRIVVH